MNKNSILSDKDIFENLGQDIIIYPFCYHNLSTSSYDVTLGENYYRENFYLENTPKLFNPYSKNMVEKVWGTPKKALKIKDMIKNNLVSINLNDLENISENDKIILIYPGETILAHTNEFIGGKKNITTMMKARSSLGRSFIEVCKCAGWGDVGYTNRWTMEITNNSKNHIIPLVVGRRISQIIFLRTGTIANDQYETNGKYQKSETIENLISHWKPEDMLPKLYLDKEIENESSSSSN